MQFWASPSIAMQAALLSFLESTKNCANVAAQSPDVHELGSIFSTGAGTVLGTFKEKGFLEGPWDSGSCQKQSNGRLQI